MERNVVGELNMYRQLGIKPNFAQIGEKCGLHRQTVAKYWKQGDEIEDRRRSKGSAFDEFRDVIEQKATLPGVTKRAVCEFLLGRHPDARLPGYGRSRSSAGSAASGAPPRRSRTRTPASRPRPGGSCSSTGRRTCRWSTSTARSSTSTCSAPCSATRAHRFVYARTRTEDDLLACLLATFTRFGGVPLEALTDNMSALVTFSGGKRVRSERAWRFAREAGFELKLCKARTPETKGKDESSNRFLDRLLAYDCGFEGEQGVVDAIARIEARSNSEPNETTGLPPAVLFMRGKEHLRPIGNLRALQEMAGRQWSVPRACIGKKVNVVAMPSGQVRVALDGEEVAVHDASAASGPIVYAEDHYVEALSGKSRFADSDIREAARANLELLDQLGASSVGPLVESSPYIGAQANLSELKLDRMCAAMPDYVRMVADGERDLAQAIAEMTESEVTARRQRIRSSGFPHAKTLSDFDRSFQPSIPRAKVEELATLRFMDDAVNVLLVGSPGVGKTHLAVSIGIEAVRAGREVRFCDCARLVEDLKDASSRGILKSRLKYYAHSKLLIIDELGYLDIDEQGADLMFQLVSTRYEQRSTIITTNVGIGGWAKVFGNEVTAGAIADRVCHHCTLLKITGRSYRLKDLPVEKRREEE